MTFIEKLAYLGCIVVLFGAIAGIVCHIGLKPEQIETDYVSRITVDKPEKVVWALSNAVENVKSRNFTVTYLRTAYVKMTGKFIIECGGTEYAGILTLGR